MTAPWQNRILGSGAEPPDQLLASPLNFRIHPKAQQDALAGVLDQVGWVQDVIVNQRTQHILDGHLRVALALRRGEKFVPVKYVDLDEAEEALILASFDPISAMAGLDAAKLDELLREVSTGDAAVQQLLDDLAIDAGLVPPASTEELWQGMPEFEQEDLEAYKKTVVHFMNEDDYQAFFRLIEQPPNAKAVWFPRQENVGIGTADEP